MTFKTTKDELEGLELLLRVAVHNHKPDSMEGKLIQGLVQKVSEKLTAKVIRAQFASKGYTFKLNDEQVMALYIFHKNVLVHMIDTYTYEVNTMRKYYNQIDKNYA